MRGAQSIALAGFDPSAGRGAALSARMRGRLAESLRYIIAAMDGKVPVPKREMAAFLARLEGGPVSPLVFGAYCDLVLALDTNAHDEAERLAAELAGAPNAPPGLRVIELADPDDDVQADRYRRLVDTDVDMPFAIHPPPASDAANVRGLIDSAFALLDAGNLDLADEICAMLQEIVLAVGPDDPQAAQFDGVSSFMLWGAIVLNVRAFKTALDMVQVLAHESGHNLLFGLCAHGPLQDNDESERYSSPLRLDPRPMDGIVHATYVSARMHQAVQRLADAGVLDAAQQDEARAANAENVQRFVMGMETIDRHARLTELGRTVLDGAVQYMARYR